MTNRGRYFIEPGVMDVFANPILMRFAREASTNAKCHISNFKVGAAILTRSGDVYIGCNVESDTHTMCLHAETNAIGSMVVAGNRNPVKIAVFTWDTENIWWPCALCRQTIIESCGPEMIVLAASDGQPTKETKIKDIYPEAFYPHSEVSW